MSRFTKRTRRGSIGPACTHCHGTGRVLMVTAELGGRWRTRSKPCPYHS